MALHEPSYQITLSSFTGVHEEGALSFSSLQYSVILNHCTFFECRNSQRSGGAARIDSSKDKNCTFCCFEKCSTTISLNNNDVGQAFFFMNGNSHIEMVSICMCPEVNTYNWGPMGLNNSNCFVKSNNETKSDCFGRCLVHSVNIPYLSISYSSFVENINQKENYPMLHSIGTGSIDASFCNIIRNKQEPTIVNSGKISYCCIFGNDINTIPDGCDGGNNVVEELMIDVLSNCVFTSPVCQNTNFNNSLVGVLGLFMLNQMLLV